MKNGFIFSLTGFLGCIIFFAIFCSLALGFLPGHHSFFSRIGGVGGAILFLWIATKYALKLKARA